MQTSGHWAAVRSTDRHATRRCHLVNCRDGFRHNDFADRLVGNLVFMCPAVARERGAGLLTCSPYCACSLYRCPLLPTSRPAAPHLRPSGT